MPRLAHTEDMVRFGTFAVDLAAGVLRKHGTRIKLQTQPFQVLAALLENPGAVVTREELRRRLWANDTFVDFEHGMNAAVARLRLALGDSANDRDTLRLWLSVVTVLSEGDLPWC
jgi:DNA-binding response OmpR family regulator